MRNVIGRTEKPTTPDEPVASRRR